MGLLKRNSSLLVPFGLKAGRLHFASEVPHGIDCGCFCPECGAELAARNRNFPGRKRVFHFQHVGKVNCGGGREGAIHRMAKEVAASARSFMLPAWRSGQVEVPATELQVLGQPETEVRLAEGVLRSDVTLHGASGEVPLGPLHVEIRYRHAVDATKAMLLKKHCLSAIEIDLSHLSDEQVLDADEFRRAVLADSSNRKWVHLADAAFIAAMADKALIEIVSPEVSSRALTTKKGKGLTVIEQHAILHKPGTREECKFQIPDATVNEEPIPYPPGLYSISDRSITINEWQQLRLRYKLFLDEIEMDPDGESGPEQLGLLDERDVSHGPFFRVRSRRWKGRPGF